MIEAGAKEVPEDKMIKAIYKAHEVNQEIIKFIDKIVEECGKPKHRYEFPEGFFATASPHPCCRKPSTSSKDRLS